MSSQRLLAAALLAEGLLAALDIVVGDGFIARSLYLLPVLAVAVRGAPRDVAVVGGVATLVALASPLWNGRFDDDYLVPLASVAAGSAIALLAARARADADAERRQTRTLADAAQITDGAGEIEDALRRLVDLLVPDFGDAAWIDVVAGPEGRLRRLATRVDGPDAEELEAWLLNRPRTARGPLSPSGRVLAGDGPQLAALDAPLVEAIVSGEEDRRLLERSGLRQTMAVPLAVRGETLGVLSLGAGRSGRHFDGDDLAFAALLAGRAALALGNARLLASLGAAQRRLDGILGALAEAVTVHDSAGRVIYANAAAVALLGARDVDELLAAPPGELTGRFEISAEDGRPLSDGDLPGARVVLGGEPEPLLTRSVLRATGEVRWLLTKATPLRDERGELLAVNIIEDVTEEKEAELRERFLYEASQALASSLDYEETLRRVARLAVPALADWCSVELPDERGLLQQVALTHVDPGMQEWGERLRERYPPEPGAPTGAYAVLHSRRTELYAEVTDEMLVAGARDEEHLAISRKLGLSSAMVVPMVTGGRAVGVMTFVGTGARRFDAADVRQAEELAARAAVAVENARLYTERSAVANTLQASLLPEQLPVLPGWRTAVDYRAGQAGQEVGGDFYDVFPVEGGAMVILGDVTGKGVTAAALTSLVRHTARTGAYFDPRPSALLALVNRALRRQPSIAPVTMVCGMLRPGELVLAIGGHPPPLLKRPGEPARRVGEGGLLLGAVDDYADASDVSVPLRPGDTLLLYTDGVTDTPGAEGRFGESGLRAAVDAAPGDPEALLEHLRRRLDAFQHGRESDDRAMIALQYTAAPTDGALDGAEAYGGAPAPSKSSAVATITDLAETPLSK